MITLVQFFVSDLCNAIWGHDDVTGGHWELLGNFSWLGKARRMKVAPMCLSRPYASIDMQHDTFQTCRDLRSPDLRSNFQIDLSGSCYTSFEPAWREEHDGTWIISLSFLVKPPVASKYFPKNGLFDLLWPLEPKLLTWGQIWGHTPERAFQGDSIVFWNVFLAIILPEINEGLWRHVRKSENLTFFDLTWPQFWPDQKITYVAFVELVTAFRMPGRASRYVA